MSWAISTRHLKPIRSYEEAKAYFEKTAPVRGASWKPLGRRSETHKRIEKRGDDYRFILYDTPVVTYTPNEVFVKTHDTRSTIDFVNYYLPAYANALTHHGRMWVRVKTIDGDQYYDNDIRIVPHGDGWKVDGKRKLSTESVLDKKKAAEVRKLLHPYLTWRKATEKMNPEVLARWPSIYDYRALFDFPNEISLYPAVGCESLETLRVHAYVHFKALDKVEVPLNRLPKKDRYEHY